MLLAAVLGGAWYFSSQVLFPRVACDEDLYGHCGDPSQWGLAFEPVAFDTRDGLRLRGWYMPAPGSRKAVIFIHGHGGTIHAGMRFAPVLHAAGYNLLAFDLRRNLGNAAESGRYYASMGCHEKKDVIAAVDFLDREKRQASIGVLGVSMGAATGILAMAEDQRIRAGIFSSGFANVTDQLAEVAWRDYGIPRYPFLPLAVWITGLRAGCNLFSCNAEDCIAAIAPRPVFIMHCTGDELVDFRHAHRLFAAASVPKQFWAAPCRRHTREWNECRPEAEQRVAAFFNRNLAR